MSIRDQLSRSLFISLIVMMIGLLLILFWGVQQMTRGYILTRLTHDAESIVAALNQTPEGELTINEDRLGAVYQRALSGHYFLLKSEHDEIRSRSLWDYSLDESVLPQEPNSYQVTPGLMKEQWLVRFQSFTYKDKAIHLWVAEDIAPFESLMNRYRLAAVGFVLVAAMLMLLIQRAVVKRSFEELENVRRKIQSFRYKDQSLARQNIPEELVPLADDIDQLLLQLKHQVSRSRHALGNLAHEMKRPLQQLQLLQDSQREELADHSIAIQTLLSDIHWLIERELKRARIVGVSTPGRSTLLDDDMPPLIAMLQQLYPNITLHVDYPKLLELQQDRDDMLELIGNLMDNACKFAHQHVEFRVQVQDSNILLTINDDGDGIPASRINAMPSRGKRLDESRQGSGLGLSICQAIVESYQGSLSFENQEKGGLKVSVCLPSREEFPAS